MKVVPGGRVELPTPAFSGPRSTGELPRHRSDFDGSGLNSSNPEALRFYGKRAATQSQKRATPIRDA